MLGGRALKKNLIAVVSAVFCGILAMLIPLCVWHQANFPDIPCTVLSLREEAMERRECYWPRVEDLSMAPFYITLILSFIASVFAYVCFKRRV